MDDELIESIMSKTTWDVMTKSEAKRYIKNGLMERAFYVTPYVSFIRSDETNLKQSIIDYIAGMTDDYFNTLYNKCIDD